MSFMNWIIDDLNSASDFFYSIYLEVYDWVWPFWLAAEFFYSLSRVFNWLAWNFYDFSEWVDEVWDLVQDILSWSNIKSLIRSWLYGIESLLSWFSYWWDSVWDVIESWWPTVWAYLQGLIDAAIQPFNDLLADWLNFWNNLWPSLTNSFNNFMATWDNFWTTIFPNLVDFTWLTIWFDAKLKDIQGLIDTAFELRRQWWEGWQEVKDQVVDFFADPEDWLYKSVDRIIERFW